MYNFIQMGELIAPSANTVYTAVVQRNERDVAFMWAEVETDPLFKWTHWVYVRTSRGMKRLIGSVKREGDAWVARHPHGEHHSSAPDKNWWGHLAHSLVIEYLEKKGERHADTVDSA